MEKLVYLEEYKKLEKEYREISNTISISEKDNPDLLKLIFENSKISRKKNKPITLK